MRTSFNINYIIILYLLTVWVQVGSWSVSRVRQKRAWTENTLKIKRGFTGPLHPLNLNSSVLERCNSSGPGLDEEPKNVFFINKTNSYIDVIRETGYEAKQNFTLSFTCPAANQTFENFTVEIFVEEPYAPYFTKAVHYVTVDESMHQGTTLITLNPPTDETGKNKYTLHILSVKPEPSNAEFFIMKHDISFGGCLDYEETPNITITLKALEEKTKTVSTATVIINLVDKNDHKPEDLRVSGSGIVKEGDISSVIYTFHVKDQDSRGSPAWRAKYLLYGEKAENFRIDTVPTSNQGNMYLIEPLDYESTRGLSLTLKVENELPFFSCSVLTRKVGELWDVDYSTDSSSSDIKPLLVNVAVENVNDPPQFENPVKHITIPENKMVGHRLWTFRATDQDQDSTKPLRYFKKGDINNWLKIDARTGEVFTANLLDRESYFVKNNTYIVTIHAVDDGEPQMTGTATLFIHLLDQNDNVPVLERNEVTFCSTETKTSFSAIDLDLPPFGGPFHFQLLGEVPEDEWSIQPSHGEKVNLLRGSKSLEGRYELSLRISDVEGMFLDQTLVVTVTDCTLKASHLNASIILIPIFIVCFLLIGAALITIEVVCKKNINEVFEDLLKKTHSLQRKITERPGNDSDDPRLPLTIN